jgi:hypothetical protein
MNPHNYNQLVFDKGAKNISWLCLCWRSACRVPLSTFWGHGFLYFCLLWKVPFPLPLCRTAFLGTVIEAHGYFSFRACNAGLPPHPQFVSSVDKSAIVWLVCLWRWLVTSLLQLSVFLLCSVRLIFMCNWLWTGFFRSSLESYLGLLYLEDCLSLMIL